MTGRAASSDQGGCRGFGVAVTLEDLRSQSSGVNYPCVTAKYLRTAPPASPATFVWRDVLKIWTGGRWMLAVLLYRPRDRSLTAINSKIARHITRSFLWPLADGWFKRQPTDDSSDRRKQGDRRKVQPRVCLLVINLPKQQSQGSVFPYRTLALRRRSDHCPTLKYF
jgi:hypothetical protein